MRRNLQWMAEVLLLGMVACGGGGGESVLPDVQPDVVETVTADVVEVAVDKTAPIAPSQLKAEAEGVTSVELTWVGSTDDVGVTGYKVFDKGAEIGTTTTTTYRHDGLVVNSEHCYRVKAFDLAGNVSDPSNEACITLTSSSPGSLTVNYSTTGLTVDAIHGVHFYVTNTFNTPAPVVPYTNEDEGVVSASSGSVQFTSIPAGTDGYVILIAWHNTPGDVADGVHGQLIVGDYIKAYNNKCNFDSLDPINTNGGATVSINIDTSCQIYGLYGTFTYTGGGVDSNHQLYMQMFSDADCTNLVSESDNHSGDNPNPFTYEVFTNDSTMTISSSGYYLRAFYDANGNGTFDDGDPRKIQGPFTTYAVSSNGPNITLNPTDF